MNSMNFMNRASLGTVIPEGTVLVSFGTYFSTRNFGANKEIADALDLVFCNMDVNTLKKLGAEITSSVGDMVAAYNHTRLNPTLKTTTVEEIGMAVACKNYSAYVSTNAIQRTSFLKSLSNIPSNMYEKTLTFKLGDGILTTKVSEEFMSIPKAKIACENILKESGRRVEIKVDSVLEFVANKAFSGDENMVNSFLKSPEKILGGIDLKESAVMFRNGKVTGKYNAPIPSAPITPEARNYITSTTGLLNLITSSKGHHGGGMEIPHGAEFISGGADLYKLGINNKVTESILSKVGLDSATLDQDAKEIFKDAMGENFKGSTVVLFNFSWLSEDYKKTKGSPKVLEAFETDYAKLFKSMPTYCGKGNYSYFLRLNHSTTPINTSNFFRIPRMIDKFVGHYNIMATFYPGVPLSKCLDVFFY